MYCNMRCLPYVIMVFLSSCGGERSGNVRHLFDTSERGGIKSVIFTAKQPNGQHCFYGREVTSEVMPKPASIEELVQSSALLTPRSLAYKDVRRGLLADTKARNVVSHLLFNPFSTPLSATCFGTSTMFLFANLAAAVITKGAGAPLRRVLTGKVAAASCGVEMTLYAGTWLISRNSNKASKLTSRKLISTHLHEASVDELERLRKIFSWLESRDAMQCPATLRLPTDNDTERQRQA